MLHAIRREGRQMSENKIGSDVLGQGGPPHSSLTEKKRQELLQKMKEEKAKKSSLRNLDDIEGQRSIDRKTRIKKVEIGS
jgi:hypothetical protein